ncbi:MAG: dihydroorotase [Pseudomonadales bacterium]|nr:dihydroorotase [Pseudomonadales bacterium]
MSLLIKGGHLIDPANQLDTISDIYIADGKVVAIGDSAQSFSADSQLDASGLIVCPGFVDLFACLPEPGFEHKGTIATETLAAAAGGVTTLCCPPNTSPVIDSPSVATLIQDLARQANLCHVKPIGAITHGLKGTQLSEIYALKEAGCISVTNMRQPFADNAVLLHCLEYAATHEMTVFFSSTDTALEQGGCVHNGQYSTRLGLAGIPESAETVALARDLLLVEQTGVKAHFGQLSTARAVDLIATAQAKGLPVTADVGILHLIATESDIHDFNTFYHVQPPFRSKSDRDMLRQGVKEGVINAICSYHQPHEIVAKMAPFADTAPGISTIETLLPLALKLVDENILDLPELIHRLTFGPATSAKIDGGNLAVGETADICIFNPTEPWVVNTKTLQSRGHNTPLLNTEVIGRVCYTFLAGRRVHQAQRL